MNLRKFDKPRKTRKKSKKYLLKRLRCNVSYIEKEDKMIAQLEANGMQVNRDVDGAAFQQAIQWLQVWSAYIEKMVMS